MPKNNLYTPEFKAEAAGLVLDQQYTPLEAAQTMGVNVSTMRKWIRQLQNERGGTTPTQGKAITPEHQEIQQLKARVKQLELEKEILKKASALLMSDSFKSAK